MKPRSHAAVFGLLLLLVAPTFLFAVSALAPPARAAATEHVTGSITGPSIVSTGSTDVFQVLGWGGPAVAFNATVTGHLKYYSSLSGSNLSGVAFTPASGNITTNRSVAVDLVVANATETLTINVMVSSTNDTLNQSTNFSTTVHVVQPYVVSAKIVNSSSTTVIGFAVLVTLDGSVIGQVNVSGLLSGGTFQVTYRYPTLGLSSGEHTFGLSLAQAHGLVTFSNGQTQYTETVYVTGPAPDYTFWYVAGIVAFFGAIFIFASRVAARRRGATRR
jgi:hypothetical protein